MRQTNLVAAVVIASMFILVAPAWAYKAEVGNRAANFSGFDIVNREVVELEDYLGQWVYIDFWATWCGPCMRDLPKMLEATQPYVDSGQLKVITISGDDQESLPELKQVLSDLGIKCPVIYDNKVYEKFYHSIPALEWGVTRYPSTFLINPQGVIVANYMWGNRPLGKILDFYLSKDRPIMGVLGSEKIHDDGRSVTINADVMNQGMGDVELQLVTSFGRLIWDEEGIIYDYEDIDVTPESTTATLSFDEFSLSTHGFVISPDESWHTLTYYLWLTVPGAEDIAGRKGRGYEILFGSEEIRLINLERVDGQWIVQP